MSRVPDQINCDWVLLVVICHIRLEVLEMDGKEHLPVIYGVHAASVQEFRIHVCVGVGQEKQRVDRVLLRDDVHEFDL